MSRKKVTTVTEDLPSGVSADAAALEAFDAGAPATEEAADKQTEQDIQAFVESVGVECNKVYLYKYNKQGKATFIYSVPPEDASESFAQANWGAGKYVFKLLTAKGLYLAQKIVDIGEPPLSLRKEMEASVTPPIISPAIPQTDTSAIQMQIQMMQEANNRNQELLMKLIERIGAPAGAAPQQSTFSELVTALSALKTMIAPPGASEVVGQMAEMLSKGIEIGAAGGAPPSSGWLDVIKDGLKVLPGVLTLIKPAVSAGSSTTETLPSAAGEIVALKEDNTMFKNLLRYLKTRCLAGHDPQMYVEFAISNMDDPQWTPLVNYVADHTIEQMAENDAEIAGGIYRPWFEELINGIKREISDRRTAAGEPGNASDASPDGGTGARIPDVC